MPLVSNNVYSVAQQVRLKGLLIVEGNECYIVSDRHNVKERIYLVGDTIISNLLDEVPCYVGGDHLYEDEVSVSGFLEYRASESKYYFSQVGEIILYRNGEEFHIYPH